jgi:hypothetical protein
LIVGELNVHDLGFEPSLIRTPHNRYNTTPLVINHTQLTRLIDLAKKAFLQANREHKQERDECNLKLQINMKLMNLIRSSSLYPKGLVASGEQDQEQGPGSQQAILAIQVQRIMSVSRRKQERNKTQTLTRVIADNYRVLGITP